MFKSPQNEDTVSFLVIHSTCISCLKQIVVLDLPATTSLSSVRFRLGLLLAAAVVPFILVLLVAHFWVYQPLQAEIQLLSRDIETRFDGVTRLQLILTRSAMPVNDYLVHGHPAERHEYLMLMGQVEAAFAVMRAAVVGDHPIEHDELDRLYGRWRKTSVVGEKLLTYDETMRRSPEAAMAMEGFDANLERLVDDVGMLLDHVRAELARSRDHLELQRERMTWFVVLSAFLATMITLSATIYLSQRVIPPLARALQEDDDAVAKDDSGKK